MTNLEDQLPGFSPDGNVPDQITWLGRPVALVPLDRIIHHELKDVAILETAHGSEPYVEKLTVTIEVVRGDKVAGAYRKALLDQLDPSKRGGEDE